MKLQLSRRIFLLLTLGLVTVGALALRPMRTTDIAKVVPQIEDGNRIIHAETGKTIFLTISTLQPELPHDQREAYVKQWLQEKYQKELGLNKLPSIRLFLRQDTPGGEVLRFYQTIDGIDAFQNDLVAQFTPNGALFSIHQSLQDRIDPISLTPAISSTEALDKARISLKITQENHTPFNDLHIWWDENSKLHLVYRVRLHPKVPFGEYEAIIDAHSGATLRTSDLTRYLDGTGYVFDPDPLTTGQATYNTPSGSWNDNNNADSPLLNGQRRLVVLRNLNNPVGGRYTLTGSWATLAEFDTPTYAPPSRTSPDSFRFTRSQRYFDDVMCYYFVDSTQRYIQSLGFNNIQHASIQIDAHGQQGDDNSSFSPGTNQLSFGEGGVDDAQDADAILHEYGHAIQYSQIPNLSGGEADPLGEGFGDYWAGSYSSSRSSFHRDWVFNWDGHNQYWDGRVFNTTLTYPSGMGTDYHLNGQIWSRALMDIYYAVGRTICDRIVLQGQYAWGASPTYISAATTIYNADQLLYGGTHSTQIYTAFHNRGILSSIPASVILTGTVTAATGGVTIPNAIVSIDGAVRDTTNSSGVYSITGLSIASHTLSVTNLAYNQYSNTVRISGTGTTTSNVLMTRPHYIATPDSIHLSIAANETHRSISQLCVVQNNGDGPGTYRLELRSGSARLQPWSLLRELDVTQITGDYALQGVDVLSNQILVSGSNGTQNPNRFYRLNLNSGTLITSSDQPTTTTAGIRDLAVCNNRVYGSDNDTIWSWDASFSNRQLALRNTYSSNNQALAIQNSGSSQFIWIGNGTSPVRLLSGTGQSLGTIQNNRNITGIAASPVIDDPVWFVSTDNNQMWISTLNSTGDTVVTLQQLDLPTGYSTAGAGYYSTGGNDVLVVLVTPSSASQHAYLRFYAVSSVISYATITGSTTGYLAANSSISVPIDINFNPSQNLFVFQLYQANSPGSTGLTTVVAERQSGVGESNNAELPGQFSVSPCYPNPFNPFTSITISLPSSGIVQYCLYDITGRKVQERMLPLSQGQHNLSFSLIGLASGLYFPEFQWNSHRLVGQRWIYLK